MLYHTCSWIESLFCIGVRRPLNHSDLFAHPPESDSRHLLNKFNRFGLQLCLIYKNSCMYWTSSCRYWDQELKRSSHGHSPRLWLAVIKCIWWRMMAQGAANLLEVCVYLYVHAHACACLLRDMYLCACGYLLVYHNSQIHVDR